MASNSRQKTTMAKLARERALRERREHKEAKKAARRRDAGAPADGATPEPPSSVPDGIDRGAGPA